MKNFILSVSALLISLTAFSQSYNLNFSQVINLTNGQTYTVPSGKTLKVESISYGNASIVYNFSYTSQDYCYYKAYLYSIGSISDSITATTFAGECGNNCNCPTPITETFTLTTPPANLVFPIWLKAGQVVTLPGGSGILLTGLEFNIQ